MSSYAFRLPFPPSLNHAWKQGPRGTYLSASGREYRAEVAGALRDQLGAFSPLSCRVGLSLELTMPNRIRRDIGNHEKAVSDALVEAGFLVDDEQIDQLIITRLHVEPPGCCDVVVTELES